jgi:hypothetical protein
VRIILVIALLASVVFLRIPVTGHEIAGILDQVSFGTYSMTAIIGFIILKFISPVVDQLLRNRNSRSMKLKSGKDVLVISGDICDLDRGRELFEQVIQLTSSRKIGKHPRTRVHERFEKNCGKRPRKIC